MEINRHSGKNKRKKLGDKNVNSEAKKKTKKKQSGTFNMKTVALRNLKTEIKEKSWSKG